VLLAQIDIYAITILQTLVVRIRGVVDCRFGKIYGISHVSRLPVRTIQDRKQNGQDATLHTVIGNEAFCANRALIMDNHFSALLKDFVGQSRGLPLDSSCISNVELLWLTRDSPIEYGVQHACSVKYGVLGGEIHVR
jgi:hypothetical protein